jgi:diacylglycerol kinase family enzyme
MKQAILFHNPTAGDENHKKEDLLFLLKENGFDCRYLSTKDKDWRGFNEEEAELLIIAGGDGTVRKVVIELLKRKGEKRIAPIALLPLGTANNIAGTLGISGGTQEIIASWQDAIIKRIDTGRVENIPKEKFFIEGFGFGLFPCMIRQSLNQGSVSSSAGESIKRARRSLHELLFSYTPAYCELQVDGTDHSGEFILVEIMNTKAIGPGMLLSPLGDPGDGELEVILIPAAHQHKFADYLADKLNEKESTYQFHTLKAKEVSIKCEDGDMHVDDKFLTIEKSIKVHARINPGALEFLIPKQNGS